MPSTRKSRNLPRIYAWKPPKMSSYEQLTRLNKDNNRQISCKILSRKSKGATSVAEARAVVVEACLWLSASAHAWIPLLKRRNLGLPATWIIKCRIYPIYPKSLFNSNLSVECEAGVGDAPKKCLTMTMGRKNTSMAIITLVLPTPRTQLSWNPMLQMPQGNYQTIK